MAFSIAFSWMKIVILIWIKLKFVPKGPIDNNPALVQIMAWYWTSTKPLSDELMMSYLLMNYASLGLNESHTSLECTPSQWRHNEHDGVSNHQLHDCLLKRLFRRRSKKTSKFSATVFLKGIHWWPVNSPHKGPVMQKMFPFDDVIILIVKTKTCT